MKDNSPGRTIAKKIGLGLLAAAFWVAVWGLCAYFVGLELFLPSPAAVWRALQRLVPTADFWKTVGVSLLRVAMGYLPGVLLGAVGGILTARVRVLDFLFSPVLTVVRATPVTSFIMLTLVFLGRDTVPPFIVFLMVLPIVWANVAEGIKTVDKGLKEVCSLYRLSFSRRMKILYLPHCLPYFSAGAMTALGLAWKAGIAAEVLCTPDFSIGKEVYDAKVYLESAEVFAWTAVVVILSLVLEKLLKFALERGKCRRDQG